MTELRFVQVDAFADRPFGGNPAAVMPLETWLPEETMQAIAAENNLSETAFTVVAGDGEADYELRWFTPATEVAMCGHATLASGHVLIGERDVVRFRTRKAGLLSVARAGAGYALDLPATTMQPVDYDELLDALGIADALVFESTGGVEHTHIILLDSEDEVRAVRPDFKALAGIDSMAIVTARGTSADIASRVFVSAWGIDEDPVTGSAHAALVPFWAPRLGRDSFTAFQASRRGGHMTCRLAGNRVILGGKCVTVIEGAMRL